MNHQHLTLCQHVTGTPLFIAEYSDIDHLYWLDAKIMTKSVAKEGLIMSSSLSNNTSKYDLWHRRYSHAGKKSLETLPGHVKGVPDSIKALVDVSLCDGCEFGKSKRLPFPPLDSRADHPLDLVHMDLVEYLVLSIDKFKYTLTTLDDYSSFGLTWFLKAKSDAFSAFKQYVTWAETQSERRLKAIRSD